MLFFCIEIFCCCSSDLFLCCVLALRCCLFETNGINECALWKLLNEEILWLDWVQSSFGEPPFAAVVGMAFVWEKTREGRVLPSFFLFSLNSPLSQIVGGNDKSDGDLAGGRECKWSIVMLEV